MLKFGSAPTILASIIGSHQRFRLKPHGQSNGISIVFLLRLIIGRPLERHTFSVHKSDLYKLQG